MAETSASTSPLWIDIAIIAAASVVFLAIGLYQLSLPGLYPDEAFDVVPTMQMLLGHPVELQRGAGIQLFGTSLPLMSSSDYQGVTSTYLALPFFAIGGISVISLRFMTMLVGVLGIVVAYYLARAWFGRVEAAITVALLAVSPAWIFWSRLGVYVVSEVVPIASGALLAFTIWSRRRPLGLRNGPLYVGTFLLGLGLATKLLFIWLIIAVGVTAVLLYGRHVWEARSTIVRDVRRWLAIGLAASGAFCLGAFPFLLYNAMTRGTLYVLRANAGQTANGVNNTAVVRNLWAEVDALRVLLDGSYFWFQGVLGRVYFNPLTPTFFAVSGLGLIALSLAYRPLGLPKPRWTLLVPCALLALAFVQAAVLAWAGVGAAIGIRLAFTLLTGAVGVAWLAISGLRRQENLRPAAWALLAFGAATGALWWFGGSGRPDGPASGTPLGLWPIDAAGILFWLAGFALVVLLGFDREPAPFQRPATAALAIIGLVVAQSAVTVSGLWSTHLLLVIPLPEMVIGAFVVRAVSRFTALVRRPAPARAAVALAGVAVAILLVFDMGVDYSYQRDLAITGGGSTFSDAIYSAAHYLDTQNPRPEVVAMDWGFKRPLQLLTEERVNPIEAYGYSADPNAEFRAGVRGLIANPNALYLFHTPDGTAYPRWDVFNQEAAAAGKHVELVKTFTHRDGIPVINVYRVR